MATVALTPPAAPATMPLQELRMIFFLPASKVEPKLEERYSEVSRI